MLIDYYYYRLGCERSQTRPMTRLRFDIAYGRYLRDQDKAVAMYADVVDKKARLRLAVRWTKLAKIAALVLRGMIVAGREDPELVAASGRAVQQPQPLEAFPTRSVEIVRRPTDDGPFPDAGAPGVREPRRPIAPLLVSSNARPLPIRGQDAPAYPSWMST